VVLQITGLLAQLSYQQESSRLFHEECAGCRRHGFELNQDYISSEVHTELLKTYLRWYSKIFTVSTVLLKGEE